MKNPLKMLGFGACEGARNAFCKNMIFLFFPLASPSDFCYYICAYTEKACSGSRLMDCVSRPRKLGTTHVGL